MTNRKTKQSKWLRISIALILSCLILVSTATVALAQLGETPSAETDPAQTLEPTTETGETDTQEPDTGDSDADAPEGQEAFEMPPSLSSLTDQVYAPGNLALAEQMLLLQAELDVQISAIRSLYWTADEQNVTLDDSNLTDIFAVYALQYETLENFPYNVRVETAEQQKALRTVFWDMTQVNFELTEEEEGYFVCNIHVSRMDYAQALCEYYEDPFVYTVFLDEVISDVLRETVENLTSNSILGILTEEEFAEIRAMIPADVTGERRLVLLAALSLRGKVGYFWGGKSGFVGLDERWGLPAWEDGRGARVESGSVQNFGLDCSGFVSWAFTNAKGDKTLGSEVGSGTAGQWRKSQMISWEEIQPGDLLFFEMPGFSNNNHVGIVLGWDDASRLQVVHCSSTRNDVVVSGANGFLHARRPYIYAEEIEAYSTI